jgi:hypothetical protein
MSDNLSVPASPWRKQVLKTVRQVVPPVITFALGRGWLADDTAALVAALAAIAWPIIDRQRTYARSQHLTVLALADDVAVLK